MKKLDWETFTTNVQNWAKERGIYEHSTPEAQLLKALSELGELADGIIKNDQDAIKDGIGDVAVCLVNYGTMKDHALSFSMNWNDEAYTPTFLIGFLCLQFSTLLNPSLRLGADETAITLAAVCALAEILGVDFMECCTAAWEEIKDRKGRMVAGGAFVKEG